MIRVCLHVYTVVYNIIPYETIKNVVNKIIYFLNISLFLKENPGIVLLALFSHSCLRTSRFIYLCWGIYDPQYATTGNRIYNHCSSVVALTTMKEKYLQG